MRKTLLIFLLLCLAATGAIAGTLTAAGELPEKTTSVSAADNVTLYIGTDKGSIYSHTVSSGAKTKTGQINEAITAIVTDGTYNYVGTNKGKIWRQTISGGAFATTPTCTTVGQTITGMRWDSTLPAIFIVTNKGRVYKCVP